MLERRIEPDQAMALSVWTYAKDPQSALGRPSAFPPVRGAEATVGTGGWVAVLNKRWLDPLPALFWVLTPTLNLNSICVVILLVSAVNPESLWVHYGSTPVSRNGSLSHQYS